MSCTCMNNMRLEIAENNSIKIRKIVRWEGPTNKKIKPCYDQLYLNSDKNTIQYICIKKQ